MRLSIRTAANRSWRPSAAVGPSATSSTGLASMIAARSVADRSAIQYTRAFSLGLNSPAPSARFNTIDGAANDDAPQCAAFVDRADMRGDPCAYGVLVGRELVARFPDELSGMLDVDYGHQRLILQQLCASIDEVAAAVRQPYQVLVPSRTSSANSPSGSDLALSNANSLDPDASHPRRRRITLTRPKRMTNDLGSKPSECGGPRHALLHLEQFFGHKLQSLQDATCGIRSPQGGATLCLAASGIAMGPFGGPRSRHLGQG